MKKEHVSHCQFSAWYPLFRSLTIKTIYLTMGLWWSQEGKTCQHALSQTVMTKQRKHNGPMMRAQPHLRHLSFRSSTLNQAQEAINSLGVGGVVFPKLNWSAPRDAYWRAMNSSLKCKTLSDIFLLFKSSDFMTRDFTQPFIHGNDDSPDPCTEYELVPRKWYELIPGAEFRCFVKENKLIGISQRDCTQYYDHISKQKEEICRCIQDFFKVHLQYKFLDEDFVFDIYRDSRGKVWLIDFNPFGEVTDSLLFTWEELTSENNLRGDVSEADAQEQGDVSEADAQEQDSPVFRCTNSEVTVQPSPYLSYGLPKDFVDLSTGEDAHKLIDFLKLKRNQQEDD